jgi:hypothetical protein
MLCRELCNGIKHLNATSAMPGRGHDSTNNSVWFFVRWWKQDEHERVVDTYRDALEVVAEARDAWKAFMIEKGGVASAALYEELYGSALEN